MNHLTDFEARSGIPNQSVQIPWGPKVPAARAPSPPVRPAEWIGGGLSIGVWSAGFLTWLNFAPEGQPVAMSLLLWSMAFAGVLGALGSIVVVAAGVKRGISETFGSDDPPHL